MASGIREVASLVSATRAGRLAIRFLSYGATSAICLGISEVTLLILVGTGLTGATGAALIGSFAGVPPSYLLSRFWIWRDADRRNTGRQVVLYWVVSLASIGITSFATGFAAHHSNAKGSEHVELVGGTFLALNIVLWLVKYVVYQSFVFRKTHASDAVQIDDQVIESTRANNPTSPRTTSTATEAGLPSKVSNNLAAETAPRRSLESVSITGPVARIPNQAREDSGT